MYSFEPSDEQKMLIDAVSRYATNDLRKAAHDAEENKELPPKLISKGWELGVLQASIPEAYGGFGERSAVTGALAAEELAYGDLAGALAVGTPGLFALPVLLAGSEEQKKQYLPPIIAADWKPYTAALIEPTFDFDPNDLKTTAKVEGSDYVLAGEKTFVPFADKAEAMIVYARLEKETKAFIVSKGAAGLKVGEEREKLMGLNAIPFFKVTLDGVKVPKANLLPGDFNPVLDSSRVAVAAMAIGVAKAAFGYSRDYAKDRDVFGVKVAQKQAIAFMLAEMVTEIEAIRLLVWEAAWALDNKKEDASQRAYLAVTGAIDMAMMVTDRAVQILGGHGYIREHPVELWMRNGRGFTTFTGLAMV
ncbi:MAG: acyl-CoA dehydrogenase family protein [Chloroflexi bacterium]|nr:acyl-CoA dehydrogenase family protein [Chloroflexota bacterium]